MLKEIIAQARQIRLAENYIKEKKWMIGPYSAVLASNCFDMLLKFHPEITEPDQKTDLQKMVNILIEQNGERSPHWEIDISSSTSSDLVLIDDKLKEKIYIPVEALLLMIGHLEGVL